MRVTVGVTTEGLDQVVWAEEVAGVVDGVVEPPDPSVVWDVDPEGSVPEVAGSAVELPVAEGDELGPDGGES